MDASSHETTGMKGRTSDHTIDSVRRALSTEEAVVATGSMRVESILFRRGSLADVVSLELSFTPLRPFPSRSRKR